MDHEVQGGCYCPFTDRDVSYRLLDAVTTSICRWRYPDSRTLWDVRCHFVSVRIKRSSFENLISLRDIAHLILALFAHLEHRCQPATSEIIGWECHREAVSSVPFDNTWNPNWYFRLEINSDRLLAIFQNQSFQISRMASPVATCAMNWRRSIFDTRSWLIRFLTQENLGMFMTVSVAPDTIIKSFSDDVDF